MMEFPKGKLPTFFYSNNRVQIKSDFVMKILLVLVQ